MKEKEIITKDYAEFQSPFFQSKNFKTVAKDESFEPTGKGNIRLTSENPFSGAYNKKIEAAMDAMKKRMDISTRAGLSDDKGVR